MSVIGNGKLKYFGESTHCRGTKQMDQRAPINQDKRNLQELKCRLIQHTERQSLVMREIMKEQT